MKRKSNNRLNLLGTLMLGLMLFGCDQTPKEVNKTEVESTNEAPSSQVSHQASRPDYKRIVVMSPDVSDILLKLGAQDLIVGKDALNKSPELKDIPAIGTHRNITPESIVSVNPDLVLGSYMVHPKSVYTRLNDLGVKAVNLIKEEEIDAFAQSLLTVGELLNKTEQAQALHKKWLEGMKARESNQLRYLLSYDGRLVSGAGTVADKLIQRAGGINAVANVKGLKPLSREGWLDAKPDIIIIADHHIPTVGSGDAFKQRPEIAASPAAKNNKVLFWPVKSYLVFGLNSPETVQKLHDLAK